MEARWFIDAVPGWRNACQGGEIMVHNFDTDIAEKYGLLEAILLNHIYYWVEKNRANNINFYDGNYWTYNSTRAFNKLFPYVSERQIKNALKHLREEGILITGNYNKSSYDRTLWYALSEKGYSIVQKCPMESTADADGSCKNARPIPDNKPDNKPDINTDHITSGTGGKMIHQEEDGAVITLQLNTGEEHPVTKKEIAMWKEIYPAVDVMQELRGMKGWLLSNPAKRKTKRGIKRFINGWLSREQDRGKSAYRQEGNGTAYKERIAELIEEQAEPVETGSVPEVMF